MHFIFHPLAIALLTCSNPAPQRRNRSEVRRGAGPPAVAATIELELKPPPLWLSQRFPVQAPGPRKRCRHPAWQRARSLRVRPGLYNRGWRGLEPGRHPPPQREGRRRGTREHSLRQDRRRRPGHRFSSRTPPGGPGPPSQAREARAEIFRYPVSREQTLHVIHAY